MANQTTDLLFPIFFFPRKNLCRPTQRTPHIPPILFRQIGQNPVPDPGPPSFLIHVCFVFSPTQSSLSRRLPHFVPPHPQQRSHHLESQPLRPTRHARQPIWTRPTKQLHQDRFRLIIRLMGQPKLFHSGTLRRPRKKIPAQLPRLPFPCPPLLLRSGQNNLQPPFPGPSLHPPCICGSLPTPPPVIKMPDHWSGPPSPKRFGQNHTVRTPRNSHRHFPRPRVSLPHRPKNLFPSTLALEPFLSHPLDTHVPLP